jgi:hypothetical protein
MTDNVPSVEEANQEMLHIQVQTLPAQIRAAYLSGVIAGRQDEQREAAKKIKPVGRTRKT